jgi:hypothetical protein
MLPRSYPMALYAFHRVLIAAAIFFDFVFTVFCIRKYNGPNGDIKDLIWALLSSVITVGFVWYFIHFTRKTARLRIELAARDRMCPRCQYDLRGSLASSITMCPECGEPITEEFRRKAAAAV